MIEEERSPSEEAPEQDSAAPEEAAAEEAETARDEPAAEDAAPESAAPEADSPAEADAPQEPAAPTHPKQVRKQARSRHAGDPSPPRSAEERAAERATARQRRAQSRRAWRARQGEKRAERPAPDGSQPPPREHGPGRPRERQGVVVSDRADKTITVRIDVTRQHRTYEKIVRSSSMLHAHDERNEAGVGDTVRVVESRPLSRTKRWRLVDVLERAR